MKRGKVYIVGAGPGDPELATLKALKAIRQADVILYDRLIPEELLGEARPSAELIYVGKESGRHTLTQDEINRLLAEKALEGKTVVRLKGGDPYVFGRGEEECMYLVERGIECEVVPGITSAIAVPTYSGIPVTHRYASSSFAIVTGREARDKEAKKVRVKDIARAVDTLIILMGLSSLKNIVNELLEALPPTKPVAVIQEGTTGEQKVLLGTLSDIVEKVEESGISPPAIIVIGDVVNLHDRLWKRK